MALTWHLHREGPPAGAEGPSVRCGLRSAGYQTLDNTEEVQREVGRLRVERGDGAHLLAEEPGVHELLLAVGYESRVANHLVEIDVHLDTIRTVLAALVEGVGIE